MIVKNSPAP